MAGGQRPTTIGGQLRTNLQRATANGQRVADDAQRPTVGGKVIDCPVATSLTTGCGTPWPVVKAPGL